MQKESNPIWRFAVGVAIGIALTYVYVRFDYKLPTMLRLGNHMTTAAVVTTAETNLYDPTAPMDVRKRAFAIIVGREPELLIEIDEAIGNQVFEEVLRRKALRQAQLLKSRFNAYDMAIEKPALRKTLERKHRVKESTALKRHMLITDLLKEDFLFGYLERRFPNHSASQLADIVLGVYENQLRPPKYDLVSHAGNDEAIQQ